MSNTKYQPTSHFFVNHAILEADPNNAAVDAFGPATMKIDTSSTPPLLVPINPETFYRTTSFVRARDGVDDSEKKVFAICKGSILIQPTTDNSDTVNLILKPNETYFPLKIKYFIYRGVRKADLISVDLISNNNILTPENVSDTTQPDFLKELWKSFKSFSVITPNTPEPEVFPASLIGYIDDVPLTGLLDEIFYQYDCGNWELPMCSAGMHLGYFTDRIGLDIILDDGDYQLEHQEELFKFDLAYARKSEHIFDTSTISNPTDPVKIARYREYILRFLDAAAFWGSHINCGTIILHSGEKLKNTSDIYNNILNKYQTKDMVYIHITEERGRSYSYCDNLNDKKRSVSCDLSTYSTTFKYYETYDWPILLKSYVTLKERNVLCGYLECTDECTDETEQIISLVAPTSSKPPIKWKPKTEAGIEKKLIKYDCLVFACGGKLCSSFIFIHCNLKQTSPPSVDYFNELWPVNIKSLFPLPDDANSIFCCTYNRNQIINLDDALPTEVIIQNEVVFDTGKNTNLDPTSKKRRLFIAAIKENILKNLIVDNFIPCFYYNLNERDYTHCLYGYDLNFFLYKGSFIEGEETVHTLCLHHEEDTLKSKSFFQLGITEEEYNQLIFNHPTVLPTQYLPEDADNVYFYLEKDLSFTSLNIKHVSKYKLGLKYEDNTGNMALPLFPSPVNEVSVYTIDGFYFFSKDFSDYQHLAISYPKSNAVFRVKQPYTGEFGFDWMRDGTTGAPGDVDYKSIMGEPLDFHGNVVTEINDTGYRFQQDPEMFKKLETEYKPYFIQYDTQIEKYYIPLLMIYPPYTPATPPKKDLDRQSVFGTFGTDYNDDTNRVAELTLDISIVEEPYRIEIEYNTSIFNIKLNGYSIGWRIPTNVSSRIDVTINCKKAFDLEQLIEVRAYDNHADKTGKRIGALRVKPNIQRKSKKILLIPVKTNFSGTENIPRPDSVKNMALSLKKFLRQIFITPDIEQFELDMRSNSTFDSNYVIPYDSLDVVKYAPNDSPLLHNFLDNTLKTQYPILAHSKYYNYIKLFFFKEEGILLNTSGIEEINGYSFANFVVCFSKTNSATATHEVLHSLDLPHSFNAKLASEHAKYTYKPKKTDNIMDYSLIERISLWEWQAEIVRKDPDKLNPDS